MEVSFVTKRSSLLRPVINSGRKRFCCAGPSFHNSFPFPRFLHRWRSRLLSSFFLQFTEKLRLKARNINKKQHYIYVFIYCYKLKSFICIISYSSSLCKYFRYCLFYKNIYKKFQNFLYIFL